MRRVIKRRIVVIEIIDVRAFGELAGDVTHGLIDRQFSIIETYRPFVEKIPWVARIHLDKTARQNGPIIAALK